ARFAGALQRHTRQQVVAVGSRDARRSRAFAHGCGAARAHGSYEELVADAEVDVVYVATEHPAHHPCALLSLEAGKHTLVEKPIALDAAQAEEIAQAAARRGVFCMEALWTLFLPRFDVVRQILHAGVLGEVRTVHADMGECFTAEHRIMRADLAGGPLLDLGTYPVTFATWVLGAPAQVLATGQPHPAGVNGQLAAILSDADGNEAVLHTTIWSATPTTATVAGTEATLTLPGPFYQPGDVVLRRAAGGEALRWTEEPVAHEALHFEAAAVARCIADGRVESPLRPLADSVATMRVMDAIRRQVGIVFPGERRARA
ncbi:MAG TPA: Gfo/Idh/MocA family oxidoreductase, partial [Solirubrobacteraceae bacterium]|nr:Gfo/Idh/MocA family oxidoreductase [Solirubrobacteraceae bacterium]